MRTTIFFILSIILTILFLAEHNTDNSDNSTAEAFKVYETIGEE